MKKWYYIALLWCGIAACSVVNEEPVPPVVVPGGGTEATSDAMIRLTVPGELHPAATYAITETAENEIRELDILAFASNGSGVDTFCYRITVEPSKIKPGAGEVNGNIKDVDVKLQRYKDEQKLIVVANASSVLNAASLTTGETLENVYDRLKFNFTGKWPVSSQFTPFPMWGEIDGYVTVHDPVVMDRLDVTMIRSIARIDVGVDLFAIDPSIGFGTHFIIRHIYVYNTRNKGFVAPDLSAFNETEQRATAPNVPSDATRITAGQEYTVDAAKYFREIYIPEAGTTDPVCLVIGATYDNGAETYYRVDFVDAAGVALSILRNHRYVINIRNILRPGFGTKEEAEAARGSNLQYELMATNEVMTEFVFDGQYFLAMSRGDMIVDGAGKTYTVEVETNYPSGWTATYSGALFSGTPVTTTTSTQFMTGTLYNTYVREGTIVFRAGTLTKTLRLRQYASSTSSFLTAPNVPVNIYRETASLDGTNRPGTTIDLLWEDSPNIVAGTYPTASNPASFTLNAPGNAVFALRDGGNNIVWTWHVWCTDRDPDDPANQNNILERIYMKYDLGYISSSGAQGTLYQWGRKEPFLGRMGSGDRYLYRGSTTPLSPVPAEDVTTLGSNPLEESHRRPMTFITSLTPPYFTWSGTDEADNSLWTVDGLKSPYDPCPAGWRVPTSTRFIEPLLGYGNSIGFAYPTAGSFDFSTGQFFGSSSIDGSGGCWTAETDGARAKCLYVGEQYFLESRFRAYALSVRCMKEKYTETVENH
ncbi:MAG: hypothetical protein LBK07_10495 [Tannerella sp.]|jgi:hypothetical protein|nr:hypothetical protein [Tannerella sp.]